MNLFYRFTPCSHPPNLVVIHEPVLEISCGQKQCAHTHTHTDRQTDRHTPMTTRPCGLRRADNNIHADCTTCSAWIITGIYDTAVTVSPNMLAAGSSYATRGHDFRLQKIRARYDLRKYAFH